MYRFCLCPRRKVVFTIGDIVRRSETNPETEAVTIIYEQILFFCTAPEDPHQFEYIARSGVIEIDDTKNCRLFTQNVQRELIIQPIENNISVIAATHACSNHNCSWDGYRNIHHNTDEIKGYKFVRLDSTRAFPPRKG